MTKTYHTIQQWDRWLTQFPGMHLLESEHQLLTRICAERYGTHTVLVGVPQQRILLSSSIMTRHVLISPLVNKYQYTIESDFYHMPIVPGSVDLVILPHTLEFVDNPHRVLSEACRIVKPEGHITILGFNPFSLYGLKKYLVKSKNVPWNNNFISAGKVTEWLKLADFQLIQHDMLLFRPPLLQEKLFRKLQFLEWVGNKWFAPLGGVYSLTAKAKVIPLTSIKLHWKQKLSPLSVMFPGPTMRGRQ